MKFHIQAKAPFCFETVVRSHGWVELEPFRWDAEEKTLSYAFLPKKGGVIEITIRDDQNGIMVELADGINPVRKEQVRQSVERMFDVEHDFTPFYELAASEPALAQVCKKAQGRLLRSAGFFEDLVKTILTTNTTWGGTRHMASLLVEKYGQPTPDEARRAFPCPERLASETPDALQAEARLGYRASYISRLCRDIVEGSIDLARFTDAELPTAELRKLLLALPGVGPYAAAHLLILLNRYDYLPVDSWALKLVSHEWHADKPVRPKDVEAAFETWGEWKALAFWFWKWSYPGVG